VNPSVSEIDQQIQSLVAPSGDPRYRGIRDEALGYLLEHADEAHPRLLALLGGDTPPIVAVAVLPAFGRAEDVPVLERFLRDADDPTTVVAGQALGQHAAPEARVALEAALTDTRDQVVASAADGLALRGDPASCPALVAALSHPNEDVRGRVRSAAERIGCNIAENPA
jgi:HEAT repeat protein